jgi:hypothetical protein
VSARSPGFNWQSRADSLSHYGKIERGEVAVQLPTMDKLAKSFGIQLSELLEGV